MKIKGGRAFAKRLKRIPPAVQKQVVKDLNIGADEMVAVAKTFVPKDELVLASTIRKEKGSHPLQVKVRAGGPATTGKIVPNYNPGIVKRIRQFTGLQKKIPNYDYALAQEFGTTKMVANPYFWPAYRLTRRRRNSRVTRNANKIIKRMFSK
ncbi:MAG: hypothetical protein JKY94_07965 [Rhodobacteraceae bacterium]|nr:hypothetical protein [Paracoccaceae bacterium]